MSIARSTTTLGALALAGLASLTLLACGGGDGGGQQAQAGREEAGGGQSAGGSEQGLPGWMEVNDSDRTVNMEVVAAKTSANSNWNFNGYANGNATITVPRGYEVTIEFRNEDPAVTHSLGIDEKPDRWSATFSDPQPVFEGAITSNATSMSRATAPGSSETITFTADQAGEYAMVCYIPGHATAGMWVWFHVSADGSAGFSTSGS
ncbi:MAG: sulfocyanin-like copper-binding protein [Gemmatimonadota bacterium]